MPAEQRIRVVRRAEFHPSSSEDNLLSMLSVLNGNVRQLSIEVDTQDMDGVADEQLQQFFNSNVIPHKPHLGISDGYPLPGYFEYAC